jgi:hypothetical protein
MCVFKMVVGWQVKSDFLAPASAMASVSATDAWGLPVTSASPAAVSPSQVSHMLAFIMCWCFVFVWFSFLFITMFIIHHTNGGFADGVFQNNIFYCILSIEWAREL